MNGQSYAYIGQPFKYLGHHHTTDRNFFRDTWSWKMPQKLTKTQKFRESQFALKNKILSFARFLRLSSTSALRNVMNWYALNSPGLGQHFKYLERHHITYKNIFRATWSQNDRQKLMKTQKFRESQLDLRFHQCYLLTKFLTSGGSKIFSLCVMITLKVIKRLPETRAA